MSGAGSRNRERRERDMLLSVGAALAVVGVLAVIASAVRGEFVDAALAALMIAAGVAVWRWRRSVLARREL